jgi:hypothetical protein
MKPKLCERKKTEKLILSKIFTSETLTKAGLNKKNQKKNLYL